MQKIGIFGGTYNPPHVGHVNIVSNFIESYAPDKMLIIPTYTPPHKISPDLASAEDRLEMCRRTFDSSVFEVSGIETERQGKSYTYDTLLELGRQNPDAKFYFLVGDDMLTTLHKWKNPEGILELCTIVAAVRSDRLTEDALREFAQEKYPDQYAQGKFEFLKMKPLELSSTVIRDKIKQGASIHNLVTPLTEEYILTRGLYNDREKR